MCTTFRLTTNDGAPIVGRTMEFGADLDWRLAIVPQGTRFAGTAPDGASGRRWTARHGFTGVTALGRMSATDGVNDAGLYAGLLYLPGFAQYEAADGVAAEDLISPDEVASLVLASASSVEEAVDAVSSVVVWNRIEEVLGGILPIHLVLHDRSGAAAVVEWVDGERHVHENRLGVCTNAPPFDWHLINLRNFVNLSATNVAPLELDGAQIAGLGQGTGLLGLPGDWTPPSRFVRATAMAQATLKVDGPDAGMLAAFHVVNAFDIPKGVVRGPDGGDYTAWSSVVDLAGGRYAVRTYEDPTPRLVTLGELDLSTGAEVQSLPLPSQSAFLPWSAVESRT
ncbi:linear amide C-N hydrolase [Conexibacter sp. CPCC 206217]|uniref:linear amide C-N hydrolase n=1 Tax=Conexibacter sp. CPCC 206217 TaxID=3064574 RepID=UPI0027222455|nr:linear amide C-N hydrolase [Conexibacter sp. CPCC 206217]MDO8211178.1 linear amide C-N hydrolase [Conexibacter sp. CPCC 206217]